MKKLLKEYFTFSRRERNGTFVLILLILIVIFYPQIQSLFVKEKETDFSAFQNDIRKFRMQTAVTVNDSSDNESSVYPLASNEKEVSPIKEIRLFYFDPNHIGAAEWKQLGVSERTANSIVKYVSKGGKFRTADDLKKMYTLKKEDFNRIAPFVRIENTEKEETAVTENMEHSKQPVSYLPKTKAKIDINTADSAQFESLYGIGAVLASRIVKFRDRLGGFFSTEQLLDVYGITPETFDKIKNQIEVSEPVISPLPINTVTVDDLRRNPYFNYKTANAVVSYRNAHGLFKSLDEVKNCDLIDDEMFEKIKPYLSL